MERSFVTLLLLSSVLLFSVINCDLVTPIKKTNSKCLCRSNEFSFLLQENSNTNQTETEVTKTDNNDNNNNKSDNNDIILTPNQNTTSLSTNETEIINKADCSENNNSVKEIIETFVTKKRPLVSDSSFGCICKPMRMPIRPIRCIKRLQNKSDCVDCFDVESENGFNPVIGQDAVKIIFQFKINGHLVGERAFEFLKAILNFLILFFSELSQILPENMAVISIDKEHMSITISIITNKIDSAQIITGRIQNSFENGALTEYLKSNIFINNHNFTNSNFSLSLDSISAFALTNYSPKNHLKGFLYNSTAKDFHPRRVAIAQQQQQQQQSSDSVDITNEVNDQNSSTGSGSDSIYNNDNNNNNNNNNNNIDPRCGRPKQPQPLRVPPVARPRLLSPLGGLADVENLSIVYSTPQEMVSPKKDITKVIVENMMKSNNRVENLWSEMERLKEEYKLLGKKEINLINELNQLELKQ